MKTQVWSIPNVRKESKEFFSKKKNSNNHRTSQHDNQQLSCLVPVLTYLASGSHYKIIHLKTSWVSKWSSPSYFPV
jgi:hypothetical protein